MNEETFELIFWSVCCAIEVFGLYYRIKLIRDKRKHPENYCTEEEEN